MMMRLDRGGQRGYVGAGGNYDDVELCAACVSGGGCCRSERGAKGGMVLANKERMNYEGRTVRGSSRSIIVQRAAPRSFEWLL